MIMPMIPQSPPKKRMENSTQKLETPVVEPRIFGPRMFPSNCCRSRIRTVNCSALTGFTRRRIRTLGTAPINGPKKGITLVQATITLITRAKGIFSTAIAT